MPPVDFGYMEEGKLGKAYDLKLMARLGSFLKPYWALIGVSLILILTMAALDLVIPYLTKEAIDRYIVVSAREVFLKGENAAYGSRLLDRYGEGLIPTNDPDRYLIPAETFQSMDRKEVGLLQKSGMLTENRYHLFSPRNAQEHEIITKYPSAFEQTGGTWFISFDRMKSLSKRDLLLLRGAAIEGVFRIGLLVLLVMIGNFVLNFFQVYSMELAGQRVMHDLRMKVFSHVQGLPVSFFDRNPVGRLVTRLTNDVQNIHEMFTSVLIYLIKDIILLIGIIVVLLQFNISFALVSFSVLFDITGKKEGVLHYQTDLRTELCNVPLVDVDPIDQDGPLFHIIEAFQQMNQRRLSGTRCPDDRHHFTGLNRKRNVF